MKKGFTLVETLIGLCLLGLIAVTVLPIVNSSFYRTSINKMKIEMLYLGELVVENIKACDIEKDIDASIYDTRVLDIIKLFQVNNSIEMIIPQNQSNGKYNIKIVKKNKSEKLWELSVFIYENKEGSKVNNVQIKAYLPSK